MSALPTPGSSSYADVVAARPPPYQQDSSHPPPRTPPPPLATGQRRSILHPGDTTPPSSPSSPTTPHTYTSLAAIRRAARQAAEAEGGDAESPKAKAADRRNGWHFSEPPVTRDGGDEESGRRRRSFGFGVAGGSGGEGAAAVGKRGKKARLSQWEMIKLTLGLAGAQIAMCLEMGFGTPELIALGLSAEGTGIVWLAGPISGLITQPLIGAISDASNSKYRRRFWIVLSSIIMSLCLFGMAYATPLGALAADLRGVGEGDWDPKWKAAKRSWSIGIAVTSLYLLDFAVNALQASLRNLLLDITPAEQLNEANAWSGRMTHLGNIVGFTIGIFDLSRVPILSLLGGGNFRKLCVIIVFFLGAVVWITCASCEEEEREPEFGVRPGKVRDVVSNIYNSILHLPRPIRRVCYVQIFAFMSWFPFLFYGTTWVADVMRNSEHEAFNHDKATQAGSLAMLFYSIVAVAAGTFLPYMAERDRRLLAPDLMDDDDEDLTEEEKEIKKIREMVEEWRAEAKREQKPVRLPTMPFMLRNIWTGALLLFSLLMVTTFFVTAVWQATIIVALVGACWAVAAWVPFSLLMEYLKEMQDRVAAGANASSSTHPHLQNDASAHRHHPSLHARAASTPPGHSWTSNALHSSSSPHLPSVTEHTPLIRGSRQEVEGRREGSPAGGRGALMRRHSMIDTTELDDEEEDRMQCEQEGPVAGGTILGIHNLAIVFPQFIVAILSSLIFKVVAAAGRPSDEPPSPGGGGGPMDDPASGEAGGNGTAWVLRFGGLCALLAAAICRRVPPTKTEKAMRRRLAEMREAEAEALVNDAE